MRASGALSKEQLFLLLIEVLTGLADDLGLPARPAPRERTRIESAPGSRLYCTFSALGSASRPSSIRR
jgi:hypothetical protein